MFPLAPANQPLPNTNTTTTTSMQPPSAANACNASCNGSQYCMKTCSLTVPFVLENMNKIQDCIKNSCSSQTDFVCSTNCNYKVMGLSDDQVKAITSTSKIGSDCMKKVQTDSPDCFQSGLPCSGSKCPSSCSGDKVKSKVAQCQADSLGISENDIKDAQSCADKKCADGEELKQLLTCGFDCNSKIYSKAKNAPSSSGSSSNSTGSSSNKSGSSQSSQSSDSGKPYSSVLRLTTFIAVTSLITGLLNL